MNPSFELPDVERITVGTVGPPGQRTFFLQARTGRQVVTLKLEKQQVSALAEYLGNVLADLDPPGELPEDLELEAPIEQDWVAGAMGVAYDDDIDRIVLVVQEAVGEEDEPGAVARFATTRAQAAALTARGAQLVEAGRPACPLCGYPLEEGHVCPRTNGHRAPTL